MWREMPIFGRDRRSQRRRENQMSLTGILIVAAAYITLGWLIAKSPMITSIASRNNLRTVDWMLLIVIVPVLVLYGVILGIVIAIGRALGGVK
jgi:predicted nucleic acid-binding Zn ribbon protein